MLSERKFSKFLDEIKQSGVEYDFVDLSDESIPSIVYSAIIVSVSSLWAIREAKYTDKLVSPLISSGIVIATLLPFFVFFMQQPAILILAGWLIFGILFTIAHAIFTYTYNSDENRQSHYLYNLIHIKGDINDLLNLEDTNSNKSCNLFIDGFLKQLKRISTLTQFVSDGRIKASYKNILLQEYGDGFESLYRCENCKDEFFIAVCKTYFPLGGYDCIYIIPAKDTDLNNTVGIEKV